MKMSKNTEITMASAGVIATALLFNSICNIGVGSTGVMYNKITGNISENTLDSGFHFVNPLKIVKKYDLKLQKTNYDRLQGLTQDSQTIDMNIVVNWRFNGEKVQKIYEEIKGDVEYTVMKNAVVGTLKSSLGKFRIDEVAKNREVLREKMQTELATKLEKYHIAVDNVEVVNIDFSKTYDDSIEAKLVAEQRALEAKNKKEQAKYEAEAKAIENKTIAKTITPLMLKQKWLEKWDGKLPQVMNGQNSDVIMNLNK